MSTIIHISDYIQIALNNKIIVKRMQSTPASDFIIPPDIQLHFNVITADLIAFLCLFNHFA